MGFPQHAAITGDLGGSASKAMNIERFDALIVAAITSFCGSVVWLVRRVLTNEEQITLLTSEIANRDKLRQEDREAVKDVREEVKGLRADFRDFMMRDRK